MKKADYEKYIKPSEFAALYSEWKAKGKPLGNDPLYLKIWDGVTNAVKACIGSLQTRYGCQYQGYDEKVLDGTALMIAKLQKMEDYPKNIVNMCYLPVLGVCCGPKAMQADFENSMAHTDIPTKGGDTFEDLIDEDGEISYT